MLSRALFGVALVASLALHSLGRAPRIRSSHDIRIVLYHGIGRRQSPCMTSLNDEIPRDVLDAQLAMLGRHYTIAALEDGFTDRPSRAPRCCLTFDDGLSSIYDWLMHHRIPAAVFINPSVIDNRGLLWQHLVSYLVHIHGVDAVFDALAAQTRWTYRPTHGRRLIELCQERFADVAHAKTFSDLARRFGVNPAAIAKREALYLTRTQITDLLHAGVQIYSHTDTHLPLARVPDAEMRSEIDNARRALADVNGAGEFVSFPFGMRVDYGNRALRYALSRGYAYVLEVGDGWNPQRRVRQTRTLARVSLNAEHADDATLYAAIELQPVIKGVLRGLRRRST